MSVASIGLEVLTFIGGTLFYGFRSEIGKWLIKQIIRIIKKIWLNGEREVDLFIEAYNKAAKREK